ncbi:MAG: hypothetical protein OEV59_09575 [Deltaproteobacteria bacterium]|nr:hypothetical protein [Deltaproteobacteria bacterium]
MEFNERDGLTVNAAYENALKEGGLLGFDAVMNFEGGRVIKRKATRSIIRFELPDGQTLKAFFLKRHKWTHGEALKRLINLPHPEDGRNEWDMTVLLSKEGFLTPVPVAYGERKKGGMVVESFYISEEIRGAIRLSDYMPLLKTKGADGVGEKRRILGEVGRLARRFHDMGFNHQDFYLLHIFYRPSSGELILVDLQRVNRRSSPARSRVIKDLGQFVFSAQRTVNVTKADIVRFGHAYAGKNKFDMTDRKMIKSIMAKAHRIAAHNEKGVKGKAR